MIRIAIFLTLLSGCAAQWTREDTIRQGVYTALAVVDWGQTTAIATETVPPYTWSAPDGSGGTVYNGQPQWRETNFILGEHPTRGQVNAYFAALIVGNALVSYALPTKWRMGWQYVTIGYQAGTVVKNYSIGIRW